MTQAPVTTHILHLLAEFVVLNYRSNKDIATSLAWTASNELYTCSDDKTIWKWNMDGEPLSEVMSKVVD